MNEEIKALDGKRVSVILESGSLAGIMKYSDTGIFIEFIKGTQTFIYFEQIKDIREEVIRCGRKPSADPKERIEVWLNRSVILSAGGREELKKKILKWAQDCYDGLLPW